jgi:hypothetical protein
MPWRASKTPDSWVSVIHHIQFHPDRTIVRGRRLTRPTFSASSSSRFRRPAATSRARRSSFAVGKPDIFAFSSASYAIRLSLGDMCDRAVDGLRYDEVTSLCKACPYTVESEKESQGGEGKGNRDTRTFRALWGKTRHDVWWTKLSMVKKELYDSGTLHQGLVLTQEMSTTCTDDNAPAFRSVVPRATHIFRTATASSTHQCSPRRLHLHPRRSHAKGCCAEPAQE